MRLALLLALCACVSHAAAAQTRVLRIDSKVLGETRAVHVRLPPDYALARQRYPVVLLLDGQVRAFFDIAVAASNYNLTSETQRFGMPPQIVVAVEQGERGVDLMRNAERFQQFLTSEVMPRVDKEFRTLPFRTLIGHSLGGRFALAAMCTAPMNFAAVVAISPSLPDSLIESTTRCLAATEPHAGLRHLVVSAGSLEPRTLANTERLLSALRVVEAPHWRVHRVDATGLEHTGTPLITIPLGLRLVFSEAAWDLPPAIADSLRERLGDPEVLLASGVAAVSQRTGVTIAPTATWMAVVVRTWLTRRNAPLALAAAERMMRDYPEQMDSHTLLADARELSGDVAGTRKAISTALELSDRIEWFDEQQKAAVQARLRRSLVDRKP